MIDFPMISNGILETWINDIALLCGPENIHVCEGSQKEYDDLCARLVAKKTFVKLNESKRPNSYLCRSHPSDVARLEHRTFIATANPDDAGPTNNWADPTSMRTELESLFAGAMRGRTMFVIPFCMGEPGSTSAMVGVQITDSAYVAVSMKLMATIGTPVLPFIKDGDFVRCLHSVGAPLIGDEDDAPWPCNHTHKYIVNFQDTGEIVSFGSGYGGNALLGKKCLALRSASLHARRNGWLAEHMLLMGVEDPTGNTTYVAAAFPSACGKTNFSMLQPPDGFEGWKIKTVGDDIAWMRPGPDGRLWAINPETGFFGVAPGTNYKTNPHMMKAIERDTIFTNCALTPDNDVWWEEMTPTLPPRLIDWRGMPWTPEEGRPAAHPNARFTVSRDRCPSLDPLASHPEGVPISAFIFGGRLSHTFPLVFQAADWEHGVYWAATLGSEATAASENQLAIRRDPFAMLPFCGYNLGDYLAHWLSLGERLVSPPPIFRVNWFRRDEKGGFIWPGFRENMRVLKWIVDRTQGRKGGKDIAIGTIPHRADLHWDGGDFDSDKIETILSVDPNDFLQEIESHKAFIDLFKDRFPLPLRGIHETLASSLLAEIESLGADLSPGR